MRCGKCGYKGNAKKVIHDDVRLEQCPKCGRKELEGS